jgi:hypothetical protein
LKSISEVIRRWIDNIRMNKKKEKNGNKGMAFLQKPEENTIGQK